MPSQETFHYSLVSGSSEFQPVCPAIKWTIIGQIISSSWTPPRNEVSPPRFEDYFMGKNLPGLCLSPPLAEKETQTPHTPWGERQVAGCGVAPHVFAIE